MKNLFLLKKNLFPSKALTVVLLVGLFFSGCSRLEIGLDWAPRVLTNRLDDVFDFSSKKEDEIKAQIQADLNEIKTSTALQLVELLKEIENLFFNHPTKTPPTPEQLKSVFNRYIQVQQKFMVGFKKTADVTLKDLTEENKKTFLRKNTEKFDKEIAESLDDSKFEKKSYERYEKIYDFLFNSVNKKQEVLIQNFIKTHKIYLRERLQQRKKFTESFAEAMNTKQDLTALFLKQFSGMMADDTTIAGRSAFIDQTIQLNLDIWKVSTDTQKEYFRKTIQKYLTELNDIATSRR